MGPTRVSRDAADALFRRGHDGGYLCQAGVLLVGVPDGMGNRHGIHVARRLGEDLSPTGPWCDRDLRHLIASRAARMVERYRETDAS